MRRDGFSLIEISIVLVIVATILTSVLPAITEGTKIRATEETADRMQAIEEAIQAYYVTNAALPCPADITLAVNVANFGRRAANANCNGGTPDANFGPVSNVTGGGVPTKDLGLPDEYAFDGWGRRIAYHVDTRATVVATFNTAGAITVNDDTGAARTTTGVYALISAGRNGHGGYTRGGGAFNAGSTNTHELANCGMGAAPCTPAYDTVLVQKMEQADSTTATDKFDDIVVYKLLGHITGGGGGAGSGLWEQSGTNIYNTNTGNVGIGTTNPVAMLHVQRPAGNSVAVSGRGTNQDVEFQACSYSPGHNCVYVGQASANGNLWLGEITNKDDLTITQTGRVGIGTTSPSVELHVNGRVRTQVNSGFLQLNNYYTGGSPYLELSTSHGAWGLGMWASSRRFKDDITSLELDTSKIYNLRPVSFNWNKERGGERDFGLIAEEVEKLFPQMVVHDKDGKPFSVRYEQLSVLLLNEVTKLKAAIDNSTAERAADAKAIDELRSEVEALKATVNH